MLVSSCCADEDIVVVVEETMLLTGSLMIKFDFFSMQTARLKSLISSNSASMAQGCPGTLILMRKSCLSMPTMSEIPYEFRSRSVSRIDNFRKLADSITFHGTVVT